MSNDKEKAPKVVCPRCKIQMDVLYKRSYGAIENVYECPKCKGLLQM